MSHRKTIVVVAEDAIETERFYMCPPDQAGRIIMQSDGVYTLQIDCSGGNTTILATLSETLVNVGGNRAYVGDTVLVWKDPDKEIKMMYQEGPRDTTVNMVASILHPECHKVRGPALFIGVSENSLIDLYREDIPKLLSSRAKHSAVYVPSSGTPRQVVIDNYWNVTCPLGQEFPPLVNNAKQMVQLKTRELVQVSAPDNAFFYMAVLEHSNAKVFRDLTVEEFCVCSHE